MLLEFLNALLPSYLIIILGIVMYYLNILNNEIETLMENFLLSISIPLSLLYFPGYIQPHKKHFGYLLVYLSNTLLQCCENVVFLPIIYKLLNKRFNSNFKLNLESLLKNQIILNSQSVVLFTQSFIKVENLDFLQLYTLYMNILNLVYILVYQMLKRGRNQHNEQYVVERKNQFCDQNECENSNQIQNQILIQQQSAISIRDKHLSVNNVILITTCTTVSLIIYFVNPNNYKQKEPYYFIKQSFYFIYQVMDTFVILIMCHKLSKFGFLLRKYYWKDRQTQFAAIIAVTNVIVRQLLNPLILKIIYRKFNLIHVFSAPGGPHGFYIENNLGVFEWMFSQILQIGSWWVIGIQ